MTLHATDSESEMSGTHVTITVTVVLITGASAGTMFTVADQDAILAADC
jgi:hypothetical protein